MSETNLTCKILFCESCGFMASSERLDTELEKKWPDMDVEAEGMSGQTGCLEVIITRPDGTTKLCHSNLAGDGRITYKNVKKVIAKI